MPEGAEVAGIYRHGEWRRNHSSTVKYMRIVAARSLEYARSSKQTETEPDLLPQELQL